MRKFGKFEDFVFLIENETWLIAPLIIVGAIWGLYASIPKRMAELRILRKAYTDRRFWRKDVVFSTFRVIVCLVGWLFVSCCPGFELFAESRLMVAIGVTFLLVNNLRFLRWLSCGCIACALGSFLLLYCGFDSPPVLEFPETMNVCILLLGFKTMFKNIFHIFLLCMSVGENYKVLGFISRMMKPNPKKNAARFVTVEGGGGL